VTPAATTNTGGGTTAITYGWDSTTTTYRIDPKTVVGNGATLVPDSTAGTLKVTFTNNNGQVLIPLPTTDTAFMSGITKVTVVLTSAATGQKKVTWKVSNSTADSWGTGGANQLDAQYRDFTDTWSKTSTTMYFNGTAGNFKALSGYTSPKAIAFCSNGGTSNALVDAAFSVSLTIESITFSK